MFIHSDFDFYEDIPRSVEMGEDINRSSARTKISYTAIKKRLDSEPDFQDAGHPTEGGVSGLHWGILEDSSRIKITLFDCRIPTLNRLAS